MDVDEIPPTPISATTTPSTSSTSSTSSSSNTTLPWVEKHRPQSLNEIFGNNHAVQTISRLLGISSSANLTTASSTNTNANTITSTTNTAPLILPHLLLYGPPGTGKTSTILAAAKYLYKNAYHAMTLELNASDERGIDVVREQIKNFASTKQIFSSGVKLIILDEADAMTSAAQAALRRIMEKFTKNTRFCLICNHVNKITPAIQSRCTRFRFGPVGPDAVKEVILKIAKAENVNVSSDGVDTLVKLGEGDLRRVINIMQATWLSYGSISKQTIYEGTSHPTPEEVQSMLSSLLNDNFKSSLAAVKEMKDAKGLALGDMVKELLFFVLRMRDFPDLAKASLLDRLAKIEQRTAQGSNEGLQLAALVAAFQHARDDVVSL